MDEEPHVYDSVECFHEKLKKRKQDVCCAYENILHLQTIRSKPSQEAQHQQEKPSVRQDTHSNTKPCLVIVSTFIALLLVFSLAALLLGVFGLFNQEKTLTVSDQLRTDLKMFNESLLGANSDVMSLINLINAAKTDISSINSQLNTAESNIRSMSSTYSSQISVLQSQLSNANSVATSARNELSHMSASVSSAQSSQSAKIHSLQTSASRLLTSMRSLSSTQISRLSASIRTVSSTQRSQVQVLETVRTHVNNPYRNCHQETRSCQITLITNDDKRLYCSTPSLRINQTVSHINNIIVIG